MIGDVAAGAECSVSSDAVYFTTASEPAQNEQIEVLYRTSQTSCAQVTDVASAAALATSEDGGVRSAWVKISAPAARTSLDCEQAAQALLDDWTQAGYSGTYQCWLASLPGGASDVEPGEIWNIAAAGWNASGTVVVRTVEIEFASLGDAQAQFKIAFASEGAESLAIDAPQTVSTVLQPTVTSAHGTVASRPAGLPGACVSSYTATTLTIDAGVVPVSGGGIEVRVEGDWGWGTATSQNLVGRFSSQTFSLPNTGVTQTFYLRQYDASTPPRYSPYSMVLNLEV